MQPELGSSYWPSRKSRRSVVVPLPRCRARDPENLCYVICYVMLLAQGVFGRIRGVRYKACARRIWMDRMRLHASASPRTPLISASTVVCVSRSGRRRLALCHPAPLARMWSASQGTSASVPGCLRWPLGRDSLRLAIMRSRRLARGRVWAAVLAAAAAYPLDCIPHGTRAVTMHNVSHRYDSQL